MEFGYPTFHMAFTNKAKEIDRPILPALMAQNKDWKVENIEKAFDLFVKKYFDTCNLIIPRFYPDRQSRYDGKSKFEIVEPINSNFYTSKDLNTCNFKLDIWAENGCSRAEVVLFLITLIVFGEILPQFKVCLTRGVKDNGLDVVVFKDNEMKQILLGIDSKHGANAKDMNKKPERYQKLSEDMIMLGVYFQKQFDYREQFISKNMKEFSIGKSTYEEYVKCLLTYVAKTKHKHNNALQVYSQLEKLAEIINGQ